MMNETNVTILGAGPAGLSAALFLDKMGIPVTLIEKDKFPRDKVCGDCLGGYALSIIHQISEDLFDRFVKSSEKIEGHGVHFFGPGHQKISVDAVNSVKGRIREVAVCKRIDFDNFLMTEAMNKKRVRIIAGQKVFHIKKSDQHITLLDRNKNPILNTNMLVLAGGSSMSLVRELNGIAFYPRDQAVGIRAYFQKVEGLDQKYIELHFLKELAPGYLWIFPLPDNQANVGLGLRSDVIIKKKIDLKRSLFEIIENGPNLRDRFKLAEQMGEIKGFPLALSMKNHRLSGNRYLLAGDSAHLIEPLFGEGIGHAMYSGKFAAEQVARCLEAGDFSDEFNRQYDRDIYQKLGPTLRFSRFMHRIAAYPQLMDIIFRRVKNNSELEKLLFGLINGRVSKTPMNGMRVLFRLITGI